MPKFLSQQETYRLIQRELPEGVYADGPPSAFFTTADNDSIAKTVATAYANLSRIYENYFPQSTDERIDDWEVKVFGVVSDDGLTLAERRSRVLAKIRKKPSLALWEILTLVASRLPEGVFVQVVNWGCGDGGSWILGKSKLGVDTILGWGNPSLIQGDDLCAAVVGNGWRLGSSALGVDTRLTGTYSWQTISQVQAKAYTYEVRIFGYELTGLDYEKLVLELAAAEPARSGRLIRQNLSLASYGLIFPASNVDQFSGVNCICRDSSSDTGYSGRTHG